MNLMLKKIVLVAFIGISPIIVSAQVKDGVYAGTLQCGPLLTNPIQGPWTQTINLTVNANNLSWERSSPTFSESGNSSIQAGRVSINANGAWNASAKNTGGWKTVAMLNLEGEKLVGLATIFSENSVQRLRDCTVSVLVKSQSTSAQVAQTPQIASKADVQKLGESRVEKTVIQLAAKATNKQKISDDSINLVEDLKVVPHKVQQTTSGSTSSIKATEVQLPASKLAEKQGPLFSTKAEFLQKIRSKNFAELKSNTSNTGDEVAFYESIRIVLSNDYGVASWPMETNKKSASTTAVIERYCETEFNGFVTNLFFRAIEGRKSSNYMKAGYEPYLAQLETLTSSQCSKGSAPIYKQALLKLFAEFIVANNEVIESMFSTAQQVITSDMCLDSICVEQDLSEIPLNLDWVVRSSKSKNLSLDGSMSIRIKPCVEENNRLWGTKATELCRIMLFSEYLPQVELLSFFKGNKQAVCSSMFQSTLGIEINTPLGLVRAYLGLGKDGRPKVREIVKFYSIPNKMDLPEIRSQIERKHPYKKAPWGGGYEYSEYGHGRGPIYRIMARPNLFIEGHQVPTEGACTPARKTITVQ